MKKSIPQSAPGFSMTPRSGILAGGNWIVDRLKLIDTYPSQDALCNILEESTGNGGSPFNILLDLARLAAPFSLAGAGLVGGDADGAWILGECARHGIDARQLHKTPAAATSHTDVMTEITSRRRTFFHHRGANALLGPEHFDFASSRAKIFHLGYLLLLDRLDEPDGEFGTVAARVLHTAGKEGFMTSVDLASEDSHRFTEIALPALRQTDFCFLNEFEASRTTGIPTRDGKAINLEGVRAASGKLLAAGVRKWVIVHFPEGAAALGRDGKFHLQGSTALPREKITGTVGAGDAFAAGVLFALHEDLPIETALRYGTAAAASCLLAMGASEGLRPMAGCLEIEKTYGVRSLASAGDPDFPPIPA